MPNKKADDVIHHHIPVVERILPVEHTLPAAHIFVVAEAALEIASELVALEGRKDWFR